jgi:hydrogenase nickel incorporation protein HypA/HybF
MHELSIAQSIAEAVEAKAVACDASQVKQVRLRIGEASGVMSDPLTFSFEMVASFSPILAGARLVIDRVPHRARCLPCGQAFAIANYVARCPECGEFSSEVISGTELEIVDMEIVAQSAAEAAVAAGGAPVSEEESSG